ncbi:MAG: hypothetical protein WCJ43_04810 [Actinomycetes bacterium]
MNKRLIAFNSVLATFISFSLFPANAAVKAGSACKSEGITFVASGKTFTCIKSGKKLIWNKGVKIGTNTSAVPIPLRPTSFEELVTKSDGISYWAWKIVQERKLNSPKASIEFKVKVGPNTKMRVSNYQEILEMTANFFSSFPQPKTAYVTFYDFPDVSWAQELDMSLSARPRPTEVSDSCKSATLCNGGNAYVDPTGKGFSYISSSATNTDYFQAQGPVVSHEYFHNIQFYPVEVSRAKGQVVVYMPDWFREGSAHWFSVSLLNYNFELVKKYQKENAESDLYRNHFKASQVEDVLSLNDGRSNNGWYAYSVGSKAIEALVLIKGIDSILDMYQEGAKGISFEEAFKKIYGISWVEAKPILAKAIAQHYA